MGNQSQADDTAGYNNRLNSLFSALANRDRRQVLRIVTDRAPEPVSFDTLVTTVTAGKTGHSPVELTDEPRQRAALVLHHTHLPKLTAAGLLEHDTDEDTVRLTDHPAFQDRGVLEVLDGDVSGDQESLDALFGAIADGRRRNVLDVLSHQFGPIHTETLARELEARGRDMSASEVPPETVDRIHKQLYHHHLPHLSTAGMITYDTDQGTVEYTGHPELRVPWMHSVLTPEFRSSLTGEADTEGIGEIAGRQNVISYGQFLCERADEELFCLFTDNDMLEAGCLTRIRDASRERGVTVYLGTRDPVVREYIQENAPEVILWEPNTDWLNLPVGEDTVGRLLLADREAVMLGTLSEKKDDGFHKEQSLVGDGADNTLVTMICQLLSSNLGTIDEEPDDISSRLPTTQRYGRDG